MPGTASISSGYTSRLHSDAVRCDQARLLARLQTAEPYCLPTRSAGSPTSSSVIDLKASKGCGSAIDVLTFPKTAMKSSVHTLAVQNNAINDSINCTSRRFNSYARVFPDISRCTAPININKIPNPPTVCQPSRFF